MENGGVISGMGGEWLAAAVDVSPVLGLLTMVLVLAVVVSLLLVKARQSLLAGYFLCGVLIANIGLPGMAGGGSGREGEVIGFLAELGVILLMFTLGIEFSLGELRRIWRTALFGGGMQVGLTGAVAALAAWGFGFRGAELAVLAVAVALSSTAVAMKSFQDSGMPNNPGARMALGVALFQDILVILFFLMLPALYGAGGGSVAGALAWAVTKGVLFLGLAWLVGVRYLTAVLHAVARTRSRELFTLTVVGLCAGVALVGERLGLGFALGAFAAGLVVSESIYSHRIMNEILPFKDLFLTIYFVSVGLMIDLGVLASIWPQVLVGTVVLLAVKGGIVAGVARMLRLPTRPALLAAASLASMGEFSLVLLGRAGDFRRLDPEIEQLLLVCTAVSMGLVPTLMRVATPISKKLCARDWWRRGRNVPDDLRAAHDVDEWADHAVICGYGPVGRSLNEALCRSGVATVVIDMNADTVRELRRSGQRVFLADVTRNQTLEMAGAARARLVAFTFPNVETTCSALQLLREINPEVCVFARAKFPPEVARLRELGVQVVHDERESAAAMVAAAMTSYGRDDIVPREIVREVLG